MPKTLLAVDDSATMRKVLEITFSGEDFRVVTAQGIESALGKLNEEPRVVVIDTALGGEDGYALCKEIRKRDAGAALILLSSRHNPYDAAKGRDAGADDYMDKPFDTQQMIDKVRKVLLAHESGTAAQPAAPAPSPAAHREAPASPGGHPQSPAAAAMAAPRPGSFSPQAPAIATKAPAPPAPGRGHTLMFGEAGTPAAPGVPSPAHSPNPGPVRPPQVTSPQSFVPAPKAAPAPAPAHAPPPTAPPPMVMPAAVAQTSGSHGSATTPAPPLAAAAGSVRAAAAATNGQLAGKLGELGLSPAQVEAVLALSREVVERVVWEVVPQLAETMIKEEIARLTRD